MNYNELYDKHSQAQERTFHKWLSNGTLGHGCINNVCGEIREFCNIFYESQTEIYAQRLRVVKNVQSGEVAHKYLEEEYVYKPFRPYDW